MRLPDFDRLASEMGKPVDSVGWDTYIELGGTYHLAFSFAQLFRPRFVEYRHCIVVAGHESLVDQFSSFYRPPSDE